MLLTSTFNCKAQTQLQQISNYSTQIIGIWVLKDDPTYKIEFNSNGIQKEYINNLLQDETYQFSILGSCNSYPNNGFDIYLKRKSNTVDYVCDIINNIYEGSDGVILLSITTERGQLEIYTKE